MSVDTCLPVHGCDHFWWRQETKEPGPYDETTSKHSALNAAAGRSGRGQVSPFGRILGVVRSNRQEQADAWVCVGFQAGGECATPSGGTAYDSTARVVVRSTPRRQAAYHSWERGL